MYSSPMQLLRQHRLTVQLASRSLHKRTAYQPKKPQNQFPVHRHLGIPLLLHPLIRAERENQIRYPRALLLPVPLREGKLDLVEQLFVQHDFHSDFFGRDRTAAHQLFLNFTANTETNMILVLQMYYLNVYSFFYQQNIFLIAIVAWAFLTLVYMIVTFNKKFLYMKEIDRIRNHHHVNDDWSFLFLLLLFIKNIFYGGSIINILILELLLSWKKLLKVKKPCWKGKRRKYNKQHSIAKSRFDCIFIKLLKM